jgi:DNA polymerase
MAEATRNVMLTPYNYSAAHTGRPGGTDGVNLTNLGHGSKLRKAIKAPPRKVVAEADASQIECRIIACLSGCKLLMDAFRKGEDAYSNFGQYVFGYLINKKDHYDQRQSMKVCVLSLQYGVGPPTLQNRLRNDGYPTPIEKAEHYVRTYRSTCHEVLACGAEGVNLLKKAVRTGQEYQWRWGMILSPKGIRLPSTRWLEYKDLCLQGNELVYYSPRYSSWQKLYPGSFNENIAQAMANDHVGDTHVKPQFIGKVALHNYDALSLVVPEEEGEYWKDELIKSLSTPPWWAPDLPLAAEGIVKHSFGG